MTVDWHGGGEGGPVSECDRCGGEFAPGALEGGLCAWCRGRVRAREARRAAKVTRCEVCGKEVPIIASRPPRFCPECRENARHEYDRRPRPARKRRAKENTEKEEQE